MKKTLLCAALCVVLASAAWADKGDRLEKRPADRVADAFMDLQTTTVPKSLTRRVHAEHFTPRCFATCGRFETITVSICMNGSFESVSCDLLEPPAIAQGK